VLATAHSVLDPPALLATPPARLFYTTTNAYPLLAMLLEPSTTVPLRLVILAHQCAALVTLKSIALHALRVT
jgi:hypothetical protein